MPQIERSTATAFSVCFAQVFGYVERILPIQLPMTQNPLGQIVFDLAEDAAALEKKPFAGTLQPLNRAPNGVPQFESLPLCEKERSAPVRFVSAISQRTVVIASVKRKQKARISVDHRCLSSFS